MVKLLSFLLLFLILFTGVFIYSKKQTPQNLVVIVPTVTPTVTPIPEKTITIISPDMKQTLIMKEMVSKDSVTHTFLTFKEEGETPTQIYTKTVNPSGKITIPFNTWSPGNKYLFLKESSAGTDNHMVITSSGKPLSKEYEIVTIEDLFAEKYKDYKITDVTGWAGPTLIVVNTDNIDGSLGPSFWFDVSTMSFIKLSTRFN